MKITFLSIDNENNKVYFKSDGNYLNDILVFEDKSIENTNIYLHTTSSYVLFERKGDVEMYLKLMEGIKTKGYYKNSIGLEFEFEIHTDEIIVKNNKILLEYAMIMDDEVISTHKISILLH